MLQSLQQFRHAAQQFGQGTLATTPPADQPALLWKWFWAHHEEFPHWFWMAHRAVLHQPSSACIERFFSLIKGSTSAKQSSEHDETIETRSMAQQNYVVE